MIKKKWIKKLSNIDEEKDEDHDRLKKNNKTIKSFLKFLDKFNEETQNMYKIKEEYQNMY